MDNFFEIIIYLFIIASLVSSFRKKKNKNEEKAKTVDKKENDSQIDYKTENKKEQSGKDILEEIQNLFNPPTAEPKEQTSTGFEDLWKTDSEPDHYKEAEYHAPVQSEHTITTSEHVETQSEHVKSRYDKIELPEQTIVTRILDDLDDQKSDYETRKPNKTLLMIRKELRNNQSLKNYIVISEILGKPKALRR